MELIKLNDVTNKIIRIRDTNVILDSDVAALYGVATREVNQAIKNNPSKFPDGYIFELTESEKQFVITNSDNSAEENRNLTSSDAEFLKSKKLILNKKGRGQHTKYLPKAFTEKGLYMLATILKSSKATQTTIAIVETFARIRAVSREVADLIKDHKNEEKQQAIMQKGTDILSEIIGNDLETTDTSTSFELNLFASVKIKHTVNRKKKLKEK